MNPLAGQSRDAVADVVGVSARTLQKASDVAEAAENDPDKFGEVAKKMDETATSIMPTGN
jgi:hypothetical protein